MTKQRARKLNVRGNISLAFAVALGSYLGANWLGVGSWTVLHTWLAAAMTSTALTAVTCFALAARHSPPGDSPQVTHPEGTPSVTPAEVQK